jgi:hypothetical protein
MRFKLRLTAWAALVFGFILSPAAARADTVFSNLGPGSSFNNANGWQVSGPGFGVDQDVAGTFTVGANSFTLTSAELALVLAGAPNLLNIYLLNDVLGAPGSTVLASTTVSGISTSAFALVTANFGGAFTLAANTSYWLVADADSTTFAGWSRNTTGDAPVAARINDGPWTLFSADAPAFRINGTPQNGINPVPTPTAVSAGFALIAIVASAHTLRRRQA